MPGSVLGAENVGMTKAEEGLAPGIENLVGETDLKHITMQMMFLQLGKTL